MSRVAPRRAIAASERIVPVEKAITADALDEGGKKHPLQGLTSGLVDNDETVITKMYVPISKANGERRTITGLVLVPEQVDAHGDIYDADVIADAAFDFLANYNIDSEMGLMHKDFKRDIDLFESYVAPVEFSLGDRTVKAGSWVMTVRVNEESLWKKVKDGKITGFSIGGKAKVKKLEE